MKVRYKSSPDSTCYSSRFNILALAEVIVSCEDGGDSAFIRDLEVYLTATAQWKDMNQAFKDRDIIPDNYNTWFAEPRTAEDRERGYFD